MDLSGAPIAAVIFDKDGTLFDFRQSWGGWTRALIAALAPYAKGDLAQVLGFDPVTLTFRPDSALGDRRCQECRPLLSRCYRSGCG